MQTARNQNADSPRQGESTIGRGATAKPQKRRLQGLPCKTICCHPHSRNEGCDMTSILCCITIHIFKRLDDDLTRISSVVMRLVFTPPYCSLT